MKGPALAARVARVDVFFQLIPELFSAASWNNIPYGLPLSFADVCLWACPPPHRGLTDLLVRGSLFRSADLDPPEDHPP